MKAVTLPVSGAADADASFAAGIVAIARLVRGLRVGHIHGVVLIDENSAGAAKLFPLSDEFAVLIENLDAVVGTVAHKKTPLGIECKRVGRIEFTGSRPQLSPFHDKFSILRELHDARIDLRIRRGTVAVGHKQIAVGRHDESRRTVECVPSIAGDAGLAQRHQDFSVRAELEYLVPLSVLAHFIVCGHSSDSVGHPYVSVLVGKNAVGKDEHSRAKIFQKLAGGVKFKDWREV